MELRFSTTTCERVTFQRVEISLHRSDVAQISFRGLNESVRLISRDWLDNLKETDRQCTVAHRISVQAASVQVQDHATSGTVIELPDRFYDNHRARYATHQDFT